MVKIEDFTYKFSGKGKLIIFEGGEGAGKTTLSNSVFKELKKKNYPVILTREPGSKADSLTQEIRRLLLEDYDPEPLAELFLLLADRAQHLSKVIIPALQQGKIIICDRFFPATFAYQVTARKVIDPQAFKDLHLLINTPRPDLIIILDIEPEKGLKRLGEKITRFDREDIEFHHKVRKGYLEFAHSNPDLCFILDASLDPDQLFKKTLDIITEQLGL